MSKAKQWSVFEDRLINDLYNRNRTTAFTPFTIEELHAKFKRAGQDRSRDALRNRAYLLRKDKVQDGFARRAEWFDGMRWGHLDIETTNFHANFGHMLSWAMYCPTDFTAKKHKVRRHQQMQINSGLGGYFATKPKNHKPGTVFFDVVWAKEVIDYDRQDQRISQTLINAMHDRADMLVTYYGTGFDLKFMRSRAMWWHQDDFPTVGEKYHLDMYYRARSLGKMHRNSLGAHTGFLGIPGKDHVLGETWGRARTGDVKALDYVINHNVEDVVILEELYERYKPYFRLTKKSI